MILPQPAHKIVPHRDAMLLIDTLVSSADGAGQAQTVLNDGSIAAAGDGTVLPLIHVELLAQTYAAVRGWELINAGRDFPIGYLVGVQKFEHRIPAPTGTKLRIDVATAGEFEGFAIVEGTVSSGDIVHATGKIKLWIPEDEEA